MLLLQAPAVRTVIGTDPHSGWLPLGAGLPLPAPPEPGWVDVRISREEGGFFLSWCPHEPKHSPLASAQGERQFDSFEAAQAAADTLFGLGPEDWLLRPVDRAISAKDVQTLLAAVLEAHGVEDPEDFGWGRVLVPPQLTSFEVPDGEPADLWLLLDGGEPGYSVFYDAESGDSGLASMSNSGVLTYIGDYGSLWATLLGM